MDCMEFWATYNDVGVKSICPQLISGIAPHFMLSQCLKTLIIRPDRAAYSCFGGSQSHISACKQSENDLLTLISYNFFGAAPEYAWYCLAACFAQQKHGFIMWISQMLIRYFPYRYDMLLEAMKNDTDFLNRFGNHKRFMAEDERRTRVSSVLKERLFGDWHDEKHRELVLYEYLCNDREKMLVMLLDDHGLCSKLAQLYCLEAYPEFAVHDDIDEEPEPDFHKTCEEDLQKEKSFCKIMRRLAEAEYWKERRQIRKGFIDYCMESEQDIYNEYLNKAMRDSDNMLYTVGKLGKKTKSYDVACRYFNQKIEEGKVHTSIVVYNYLTLPWEDDKFLDFMLSNEDLCDRYMSENDEYGTVR